MQSRAALGISLPHLCVQPVEGEIVTDRQNQPAVLRRKVERLEALLAAEKHRGDKCWAAYRELMYENVDMKLKLDRIAAAVNGGEE